MDTYEKKYKKVLLKARVAKQNTESAVTIGILEEIFPELKESEDEKIRKELISFVENWRIFNPNSPFDEFPIYTSDAEEIDKILAWLEKQGEPTEINPSEFDLRLNKLLKQFESLPKEELVSNLSYYLNVIQNDGTYKIEKKGEKKSITIDADPIASYDNVMISDIEDEGIDNISPEGSVNCVVTNSNKQGEKSQRIISAEAKEALYNKPALSEEDEVKINRIVACLENLNVADNDILLKDVDWLKSIKNKLCHE